MSKNQPFIALTPGEIVTAGGRRFRIRQRMSVDSVLAEDIETTSLQQLRIDQLSPGTPSTQLAQHRALETYTPEEWAEAKRRLAIIKPLIDSNSPNRKLAESIADNSNVHVATIYRWIKNFRESGHLSSLLPGKRGRNMGHTALDALQEKLIGEAIESTYLQKQRFSAKDVVDEVERLCRLGGVPQPHANTVRRRLKSLPDAMVLRRRGHRDKARNLYDPIISAFPGADFPLAVVQIDHGEADVIVVDEIHRQPLQRPWITLAIDVFSRMVVGCYISMERPNAAAAGLCLSMGMLPKADFLARIGVPGQWPVWGRPRIVHADNAKEFRGQMLAKACEAYNIDLQMRPVKRPHYGGHIERLMRTHAVEFKKLPGATFSNPKEREGYDSDRTSALTLKEFETHVFDFIVNIYHQRKHSDLQMPPVKKWEQGILGNSMAPGTGLPPVPADPQKLKIDFLPFVTRTVQPYGLLIDDIFYYHEVLNRWINAMDPEHPNKKRQFIVKRDPRDISQVMFFDPELNQYFPIPYRDTSHPPVSLWEFRNVRSQLRKDGDAMVDEQTIFDAIERNRARVQDAVAKTKKARREQQRIQTATELAKRRQENADKAASDDSNSPSTASIQPKSQSLDTDDADIFSQPIRPFDDLET